VPWLISFTANFQNQDANYDAVCHFGTAAVGQRIAVVANHAAGGSSGNILVDVYGVSRKTVTNSLVTGVWATHSVLYNGGNFNTTDVLTFFKDGVEVSRSGESLIDQTSYVASNTSYIAASPDAADGLYTIRGQIGTLLLAKGSVAELMQIMRAHCANPYSLLEPRQIILPDAGASAIPPTLLTAYADQITTSSARPNVTFTRP
jgi:hypothetical protein